MKKKIIEIALAGIAVLALTGCQNNKQNSSVSKTSGNAQVKKNNGGSTNNGGGKFGHNSDSSDDDLWDSDKQDKLDDFFDDWADTMDQEYDKYDGDGQITTAAGEKFPRDFNRVYINNQKVSLTYAPDGKGNADYNVVAIYNHDSDRAPLEGHITYFFSFHDGKPIVLVDETTNGDKVMVKETANQDLINGFNSIANGQNASMPDKDNDDSNDNKTSDDDSDSEDLKLIGVFVGLLKDGDWFKSNLKNGHMYFSESAGHGKTAGYDCITTGGSPASYFWFKQDGDDITVKYSDPDHVVSDGVYKTEHYTVDRLKSDYYVNSGQKAEVNGYVNKLKPLSELGN